MQNFTAADLVQTTLATLALALFLLPPGYLLCWIANIGGMRNSSAAEKTLFSLAFSVGVTPILAVLLTRISSYTVTLAVFLLLALVALFALARELPRLPGLFSGVPRSTWLLVGIVLVWFVVVQVLLADWQIGRRLYVSYVAFDHSVRLPFVEAAARSGVPPRNPFYGLGTPPVLRYFYYWYLVCALPERLFGLPAKACFDASVFWSGLGLASLVPLYLKHFSGEREQLRAKSVLGIALLAVTGLDLLPYAAQVHRYHMLLPDIEWWEPNQVTSWLDSLLWVPHHVASLSACMAGLLALSFIDEDSQAGQIAGAALVAGACFASAAGLSVYVTFPFALFAVIWTLLALVHKNFRSFLGYAASGGFALLLSAPYLRDLLSKPVTAQLDSAAAVAAKGAGEQFALIEIRDFPPAMELLHNMGLRNPLLLELAKLPILVYMYALEFGFFGVVFFLWWRRDRRSLTPLSRQHRMAWTLLGITLLAMSVLKSNTTGFNDLGWRGMLLVQFMLLIWSVPILHDGLLRRRPDAWPELAATWVRASIVALLALGLAGSAVQLALLRVYPLLADSGKIVRSEKFLGAPGFGVRTYWLREGFTRLNELTPPSATVQYNPVRDEVPISHLYLARQALMGDSFCGAAFGGSAEKCRAVFPLFATVFNAPDAVRSWDLDQFCRDFQLDVLVANDADPVWSDRESWVWTHPVVYANPAMRAVMCDSTAHLSAR